MKQKHVTLICRYDLNTAVNLPSRQVWRGCHGFDITCDRRNCVFLARLAAAELFVDICVLLRIEVILVILPGFFGHFVDSSAFPPADSQLAIVRMGKLVASIFLLFLANAKANARQS